MGESTDQKPVAILVAAGWSRKEQSSVFVFSKRPLVFTGMMEDVSGDEDRGQWRENQGQDGESEGVKGEHPEARDKGRRGDL